MPQMPQVGEQRTSGGETRQWDGQAWRQVEAPAAPSAGARFAEGFGKTNPITAVAGAIAHPIDTAVGLVADPVKQLFEAGSHAKKAIMDPNAEGWRGRASEAAQAVESVGKAVPFIGAPLAHMGEQAGKGNFAGAAGEAAGLASTALVPELPAGISKVGRGLETTGRTLNNIRGVGGKLPASIFLEEAIRGHPIRGAAIAAAPTAMEAAGKGLQAIGNATEPIASGAVDALRRNIRPVENAGAPYPRSAPVSTEVPYRADAAAMDPNQVLSIAREIATETGQPLDAVLQGWGKQRGAGGSASVDALRNLANSGAKKLPGEPQPQFGPDAYAGAEVAPEAAGAPVDPLRGFDEGIRFNREFYGSKRFPKMRPSVE